MDISEIWNNIGYLIATILAFILFLFARRIQRKHLRLIALTCSIVFFSISGIALLFEGYYCLKMTVHHPAIVSSDGKHIAVIYWSGVIFDENYAAEAHVYIRSRFSPFAKEVYSDEIVAPSLSDLTNHPQVRWLDGHHLLISNSESGMIMTCSPGSSYIEGIEVLCQK